MTTADVTILAIILQYVWRKQQLGENLSMLLFTLYTCKKKEFQAATNRCLHWTAQAVEYILYQNMANYENDYARTTY